MPVITGSEAERSDPTTADRNDRVRAVVVAAGVTIAAILVSILVGVAFVFPMVLLEYDVQGTPAFLVLTAVGQIGFLAVAYWYARRRGLQIRVSLPNGRDVGYIVGGTVGALVIVSILAAILEALDLVPGSVIEDAAAGDPTLLLGLAALSVVLIAPVEEFLFRGVVQGRLREAFGPIGAVAGASLLFGSVHLANYTGAFGSVLAGALLIAGTGTVLGVLYELTRNLTVPIVTHALYNAVLLAGAYLFA